MQLKYKEQAWDHASSSLHAQTHIQHHMLSAAFDLLQNAALTRSSDVVMFLFFSNEWVQLNVTQEKAEYLLFLHSFLELYFNIILSKHYHLETRKP